MFKLNWRNLFKRRDQEKREETPSSSIANVFVTKEEFKKMFPLVGELYFDEQWKGLNQTLHEYSIIARNEIAKFCAQVGHESGGLRYREENLNYSAEALMRVFGKYFDLVTAKEYARNEEKIANRVYANRMGNGTEISGDGWRFRGRGFIQLTGFNNYNAYAKYKHTDVWGVIDYLSTIEGAWDVAGWYFWENACYGKSIKEQTKIINGGYNGLSDREFLYDEYCKILGVIFKD